jgi:hypothetical protein
MNKYLNPRSNTKTIKVKATVIIDMELENGYTLEEAMDELVVNMHSGRSSVAYVYDNEITYYEELP